MTVRSTITLGSWSVATTVDLHASGNEKKFCIVGVVAIIPTMITLPEGAVGNNLAY